MKRLFALLSSFGLTCVVLIFLLGLTWQGTLAQVDVGLHEAQKKYFDSLVWWQALGPLALPMPGARLLLYVLFVNLVCGGIVRLRKRWSTAGVLTVHLGILLMLVAGFVKFHHAEEGFVRLHEGQAKSAYTSFLEWEIAVAEAAADGAPAREHVIPGEWFADLGRGETARFTSPSLPFDVEVSDWIPNADPVPAQDPADPGAVDGFVLRELPKQLEAELNLAGARVRLIGKDGEQVGLLWGGQHFPWTVTAGADGRAFAVDLRKKTFPIGFELRLDKFTKTDHPGSVEVKDFRSRVTRVADTTEETVEISMNEPMRHGGLIFYQTKWAPPDAASGGGFYSIFAVVNNPSDQWPLISCIVIGIGLLLHFGLKLYRYAATQQRARPVHIERTIVAAARRGAPLLLLGLAFALAPAATAADETPVAPHTQWPDEVLDRAASIAVQDGGRIKPLSTLASFHLLRLNGKRSLALGEGRDAPRLTPTEWLLDCMFFPERAATYECFLIEDRDVLDTIGVAHEGKRKRDRYSFEQLRPGFQRLFELADRFDEIEERERTPLQKHIVNLAQNVQLQHGLLTFLGFARESFDVGKLPVLAHEFPGRAEVAVSEVAAKLPELLARYDALRADEAAGAELAQLEAVLEAVLDDAQGWAALAIIPPPAGSPEWLSPGRVVWNSQRESERNAFEEQLALVARLEALDRAKTDPVEFAGAFAELSDDLERRAEARGEAGKVDLEVLFYKADFFFKAQWLFVLAFLASMALWLKPQARAARAFELGSWGLQLAAVGLLAIGITIRCILRGRPPVSTLYESILFITAVGVSAALVTEGINRQRIALLLASVLGAAGMFLAGWYEEHGKVDTMPTLQAVLDTNFWLSTHVTTVTMGYAAGFLAAAMAHVFLIGKLLGLKRGDTAFYRGVTRMVYGAVCFSLVFSTVGTILGGIWANESWGRFWGWDPKENGALMIVLMNLIILHGRLGGFLRDFGLCLAAVFLGTVVAFSWFHTNLLGVGLHAYGFDSKLATLVWSYYAVEWSVIGLGALTWLLERRRASGSVKKSPASIETERERRVPTGQSAGPAKGQTRNHVSGETF